MKTSFSLSLLFVCLSLMIGCQKNSEMPVSASGDQDDLWVAGPQFTYPVQDALKDIALYDSLMSAVMSDAKEKGYDIPANYFKGFTVRSVDLLEAMGLAKDTKVKYDNVRVYLGLSTVNFLKEYKLFLTPVDGADLDSIPVNPGKDHILKRKIKNASGLDLEEGYVMDFAMPCPATCPDDILIY
jgi:hypothetical protein